MTLRPCPCPRTASAITVTAVVAAARDATSEPGVVETPSHTTAMIVLRVIRWRRTTQQSLEFDAPTFDTVERLNLSGALN